VRKPGADPADKRADHNDDHDRGRDRERAGIFGSAGSNPG